MSNSIPFAPNGYYKPNNRIADLILMGGNQQARIQQQKGDIWANTAANIGGIAANTVADVQEAKALSKRDSAFNSLLEQTNGNPDPRDVYRIFGPDKAPKIVEGLASYQAMSQKRGEEAAKHLPGLITGLSAMSPELRREKIPMLREMAIQTGAIPADFLPEDPDEAWKFVSSAMGPKPEAVKTREIRVRNADGSESIEIVEDKPGGKFTSAAEVSKPNVVQTPNGPMILDNTGVAKPITTADGKPLPQAPKAPKEDKIVTIDGVPMMVNASGQAKPITGVNGQPLSAPQPSTGDPAFINQPGYQKLSNKQRTQADSLNALVASLDDYKKLVDETSGVSGVNMFGADSGLLETKLNSIIFAAAQAEGTGALQQADRQVIEKIVPNGTNLSGAWNAITKGGKAGMLRRIQDQIEKYDRNIQAYGLRTIRGGSSSEPLKNGTSVPAPGAAKKIGKYTVEVER